MKLRLKDGRYALTMLEARDEGLINDAYECFVIDQIEAFRERLTAEDYFESTLALLEPLGFEVDPETVGYTTCHPRLYAMQPEPEHDDIKVQYSVRYRYVPGWRKLPQVQALSEGLLACMDTLAELQRTYFYGLEFALELQASVAVGFNGNRTMVEHQRYRNIHREERVADIFAATCDGIAEELRIAAIRESDSSASEEYFCKLLEDEEIWITSDGGYLRNIELWVADDAV